MKASDVFTSKWLKADDLDGDVEVVIDRVKMETLKDPQTGQDQHKPVVYFRGEDKGVVLNVTNWRVLEDVCGSPDSDEWAGKTVTIGVSQVEAFGKVTDAIRFRPKPHRKAGGGGFGRRPASEQDAADAAADQAAEDEIPY